MPDLIRSRLLPAMLFALLGLGAASLAGASTGTITVAKSTVSVVQSAGTVSIEILRSGGSTGAATIRRK